MTKPTFEQVWTEKGKPSFGEVWGRSGIADPNDVSLPGQDIVRISRQTKADVGMIARMSESLYRISAAGGGTTGLVLSDEERAKSVQDAASALTEAPEDLVIGGLRIGQQAMEALQRRYDLFVAAAQNPEQSGAEDDMPGAIAFGAGIVKGLADAGVAWFKSRADARADAQAAVTIENAPITFVARKVMQQGVPSVGVAMGLSLITGNPAAGMVAFYETTAGGTYAELRRAGVGVEKAGLISRMSGAAEVGGEMLVFPKFIAGLQRGIPLRNVFVLMGENYGQEFATGFTQGWLEDFGKRTSAGQSIEAAAEAALDEAWRQAKEGGLIGAATVLPIAVASLPASIYRKASEMTEVPNVEGQAPALQANGGAPVDSGASPATTEPTKAEAVWQRLTGEQKWTPANDAERELIEAFQVGVIGSAQDVAQWMGMESPGTQAGQAGPAEPLPTPVTAVAGQAVPYEPGVETGRVKERKFVTSLKQQGILPKDATAEYRQRPTEPLAIKAANLVRDDIDQAEAIARTRTDDAASAVTVELLKELNRQRAAATADATRNTLTDKINEIIETVAPKYTEAGRMIQALSILGMNTPEGQLRFAQRQVARYNETHRRKIPGITREQSNYILDEMAAIKKLPNGKDKAIRYRKLQDYIGALTPSTFYEKAVTLWKAGLLTGIKTSGLNVVSNLMHGVSEVAKDIPATAADSVLSLFTGQRTIAMTARGSLTGLKEGFQAGVTYFRTGYSERDIALKYDWHKVNFGKSKVAKFLQGYEENVFRILGSQDYPFYYGAKARSIVGQAIAKAKNEKLAGKAFDARVDELTADPTDDMLRYAVIDAETAVFANQTLLGDIARQIQKAPVVGQVLIPFGRTPSAIAMQIINYSPVGAIKAIAENINNFDQRTLAQELGRAGVGTGVMWLGAELFTMGLMTLDRPEGEKEKELWKLEGRSANSIKIGDKWRSAQVLGPVGTALIIGGHFARALGKTGSPTKAVTVALSGGAKSFSEQTFVKGLNMAIGALQDPERSYDGFVSSMAGSVVPTIVADIARASDTVERRASGPIERIESRLPGARQTLEPDINVFGQDLPRYGGNVLEVMFDPTRPAKIRQDVVVDELRRLWDAGHQPTPTKLGDRTGYKALTPSQNTELWRRAGEMAYVAIWDVMTDPLYQSADDEEKARYLDRAVEKAKLVARAEIAFSLIDGLAPDKREQEIKRLRDGGLVVNAVERILETLY